MVLSKEEDFLINVRKEFKIDDPNKLRAENEIKLKCTSEFKKCKLK